MHLPAPSCPIPHRSSQQLRLLRLSSAPNGNGNSPNHTCGTKLSFESFRTFSKNGSPKKKKHGWQTMDCSEVWYIPKMWVCLKIVYPWTQWLMIIIPMKNGYFIWIYPTFSGPNPCHEISKCPREMSSASGLPGLPALQGPLSHRFDLPNLGRPPGPRRL